MQEVVDEVLKAEAGAQEIIDKAGQEAAHLKQQAENETNRRIAEAREKARKLVQDRVAAERDRAASEYTAAIRDAETKNERFWEQNAEKIDGLVKRLVDFLVTPEFEKD